MNFKRFTIGVLVAAAFVTTSFVYAQDVQNPDFKEENIVTVAKEDVVNKDFFGIGQVIEVNGIVNGDVYAMGSEVIIKGTVNGDVLGAGGRVTIAQGAIVTQDIRLAGGRVIIEGSVDKNITALGGTVLIGNEALIKGNITAAGADITIQAPVIKNIKIAAGNLNIDNIIGGDADLAVKNFTLADSARINGNVTYTSDQELAFDEDLIAGTVTHYTMPQEISSLSQENRIRFMARTFFLINLLGLVAKLLIGLLFIHIFPAFSRKAAMNLRAKPWRSLGTGFLIVVLSPVLIIALMLTVIGLPIAFIFITAYILGLYLSPIIVMLAIGQLLSLKLTKTWNDGVALVAGLAAVTLLRFIPVVNFFSIMLFALLGVGVFFNTKVEIYNELRNKNII